MTKDIALMLIATISTGIMMFSFGFAMGYGEGSRKWKMAWLDMCIKILEEAKG